MLAKYTVAEYGTARAAYIALTTDAKFICPARQMARAVSLGQSDAVYRYLFTHGLDNAGAAQKALGAFHGLELPFVFDKLSAGGYPPSAGEVALGAAMRGYWARFAATAVPDGAGSVPWPRYDAAGDSYLGLDATIAAAAGVRTTQCDFWDSVSGL